MPKAHPTWTVHAHGPLVELSEGIWTLDGSLPDMPLPRRFTLARMQDGSLLLHNAIAVDDATREAVERLGALSFLVVPNGWHRLDSRAYKARYPGLRVVCPRGSRKRVEEVVPVDLTYDAFPSDERVRLVHLEGLREAEGVLEVRGRDGVTLVFNDLIFNLRPMGGLFGLIYGRLMGNAGGPRITTITRLFVVKDKAALSAHLERLARTPDLRRVVMSHGDVITEDAPGVLASLAASLR